MSEKDFLVQPRIVEHYTVYEKGELYQIKRLDGAWENQDFYEWEEENTPEGKDPLVSVICPHDPDKHGTMYCSIYARNSPTSSWRGLFKSFPKGVSRSFGFNSVIKTVDEARKLVPAIIRGNLQESEEFKKLEKQIEWKK